MNSNKPKNFTKPAKKVLSRHPKAFSTEVIKIPRVYQFITAIHNTDFGAGNASLGYGKSLGGTRVVFLDKLDGADFKQKIQSAESLACALSRDMTYKWVILNTMLNIATDADSAEIKASRMGGGKSIIVAESLDDYYKLGIREKENLFIQYGEHIENLNGDHITAVDMHTTTADMDIVMKKTQYVACQSEENGGTGNPSPITARGVFAAVVKTLKLKEIDPEKATYLIQGVGSVGSSVVQNIRESYPEARIIISDLDLDKIKFIKKYNVTVIDPENIYKFEGDVFIPCAGPNILNWETLDSLQSKIVCGGANDIYPTNELGQPINEIVKAFYDRGFIVVPAPVANLGGILHVAIKGFAPLHDHINRGNKRAMKLVEYTAELVELIYQRSLRQGLSMEEVFSEIVIETYAEHLSSN